MINVSITMSIAIPDGLQVLDSGHKTPDPTDMEYEVHQLTNVRNYLYRAMDTVGIQTTNLIIRRLP